MNLNNLFEQHKIEMLLSLKKKKKKVSHDDDEETKTFILVYMNIGMKLVLVHHQFITIKNF